MDTSHVAPSRRRIGVVFRAVLGVGSWGLGVALAWAQFGGFGGELSTPIRRAPEVFPDRNFVVCRLQYREVRSEPNGGGWRTDYPYGEINLTIRFSELTKTPVSWNGTRQPNHYVVRATDDELFQCPFLIASDVGTMGLTQPEADRLRLYLLKGGFLWVDDFWGVRAWQQWAGEIAKALPPAEFPIVDVPISDPIFSTQFVVTTVPQITNIQFWRGVQGTTTSERGEE